MTTSGKTTGTSTAKAKNETKETIKTVIIAVILALLFRGFVFEPFHIPSGSMKSTLLIGDYLFVSKYSYGYSRYSFPFGMPLFKGRILESTPKRGDIVVFRLPRDPHIDYIKRLIGLPGDRIQVKDGNLFINGKAVPKDYTDDWMDGEDSKNTTGKPTILKRYEETLPEGKTYQVLDETPYGAVDNTEVYTVPEGKYFMMGDNRDNSRDSRYLNEVGFVPAENLVGRAELILFSWRSPFGLRFDRFFTKLP